MSYELIYRTLVPNAPLYRRTQGDGAGPLFESRSSSNNVLLGKALTPGLQQPSLVSSFKGSIDAILFCFPKWATQEPGATAYQSVIRALRPGTRFVVVHHATIKPEVASWFSAAGHGSANVQFVGMPDYVSLTDWAEDAYVSLKDEADGSSYLMEPWEFKRAGDALIADAVEDHSDIKASQAPLVFQGGNCLVGSDFWMLGKDYFVDTLELLQGQRPPITVPEGQSVDAFATELFSKYVDGKRRLVLIGTKKAIPHRQFVATKAGSEYFLDIPSGGTGMFQPIFHIDMFISLVGLDTQGRFEVLVGSPALADNILGTQSPFALEDVFDSIAKQLTESGFAVRRNPLVHRAKIGNPLTLAELKEFAAKPGYEGLVEPVKELAAAGAVDTTEVRMRDWHHITWNNCLVENSAAHGKHVYLPTFGHGDYSDLAKIDAEMRGLWEKLGFTVHLLADFNSFAERQGVVHCIKKYLARGD